MTNPPTTQSQKRFHESAGALFSAKTGGQPYSFLFLKSSTDVGVMRNGGRNGARYAPQSLLATFKKFAQTKSMSELAFLDVEVSDEAEELKDFSSAQRSESDRIRSIVKDYHEARICHVGGGHDHVFPLLTALAPDFKKVLVINIDAHADTRVDEKHHSGTPFRQFANSFSGDFQLYQIGLHPFANSFSTLSPLSRGKLEILWRRDLNSSSLAQFFSKIKAEVNDETLVLFSLDADALIGSEVPGVSAVNPGGITRSELLEVWDHYRKLPLRHRPVMGIYELNPLYDTLSSLSMRTLASFVFETI
jgi:formiminoglutamase